MAVLVVIVFFFLFFLFLASPLFHLEMKSMIHLLRIIWDPILNTCLLTDVAFLIKFFQLL